MDSETGRPPEAIGKIPSKAEASIVSEPGSTIPAKATTGLPCFRASSARPAGRFSPEGLGIEPAFSGDYQVGVPDRLLEIENIRHQIEAGPQFGIQKGQAAEPESSRRAGAGLFSGKGSGFAGQLDQVPEPGFVLFKFGFRDAFLRSVNAGGAVFAQQWIGHIAGDQNRWNRRPVSCSIRTTDSRSAGRSTASFPSPSGNR